MKRLLFVVCALMLLIVDVKSQSITIGDIPGTAFCTGDKVMIPYTASGNFTARNSFIVQISDKDGDFDQFFYNAGDLRSPISGTIEVTIPQLDPSRDYRLRVVSSDPFVVSQNVSNPIGLGPQPVMHTGLTSHDLKFGMVGQLVSFESSNANTSVSWDFGPDANPRFSSDFRPSVTFAEPGFKTISMTATSLGGCSKTVTNAGERNLYIGSCTPVIPKTALVDSVSNFGYYERAEIWVVPGGVLSYVRDGSLVFAEAGATITDAHSSTIYYMKAGSVVDKTYDGIFIHEDGVGFGRDYGAIKHRCPDLEFDYSDAPPYKIQPASVSRVKGSSVQLYPNPATSKLTIDHREQPLREIIIRNALGAVMMFVQPEGVGKTSMDVSSFAPGLYFIDVIGKQGIETHKIVIAH